MKIENEVIKQSEAEFLKVKDNCEWLPNIVSVPKKDEMVRTCFDYRDLNKPIQNMSSRCPTLTSLLII